MKVPKEMKRFCPKCKTHTKQKVKNEKNRGKNKTNPMTQFSKMRLKLRGLLQSTGRGNSGKMSRGALNSWKRFNKKHSKKTDLRFTCPTCNKTSVPSSAGARTKKISVE